MEYIIILLWVLGAWSTAAFLADRSIMQYGETHLDGTDVAITLLWPLSGVIIFCMELYASSDKGRHA